MAQERYGNEVDFIKLESNIGFGPANNIALQKVLHPYTLLLNPDTIIMDKGIGQMLSFIETHQDAGLVGCRLLNPDRTVQHSINKIPTMANLIIDSFAFYKLLPEKVSRLLGLTPSYEQITRVGWLRGAFLLGKTDLFKQLEGFDPNFFMYGEDLDICYRTSLLGYQNYFVPFTSVVHYGNISGEKKYGDARLNRTFKSLKLFLVKFYGEQYAKKYLHTLTESYQVKRTIRKIVFRNPLKIQEYEAYINALSEINTPRGS